MLLPPQRLFSYWN